MRAKLRHRIGRHGCNQKADIMADPAQTKRSLARSNVTPVWLLTFWRIFRGPANGDYASAWIALRDHLPPNTRMPTMEEVATVLVQNRLV